MAAKYEKGLPLPGSTCPGRSNIEFPIEFPELAFPRLRFDEAVELVESLPRQSADTSSLVVGHSNRTANGKRHEAARCCHHGQDQAGRSKGTTRLMVISAQASCQRQIAFSGERHGIHLRIAREHHFDAITKGLGAR